MLYSMSKLILAEAMPPVSTKASTSPDAVQSNFSFRPIIPPDGPPWNEDHLADFACDIFLEGLASISTALAPVSVLPCPVFDMPSTPNVPLCPGSGVWLAPGLTLPTLCAVAIDRLFRLPYSFCGVLGAAPAGCSASNSTPAPLADGVLPYSSAVVRGPPLMSVPVLSLPEKSAAIGP